MRIICLMTLLSAGCSRVITAEAVIINALPVDGCSYIIEVGTKQYVPDTDSLGPVRSVAHQTRTAVHIQYVETGDTGRPSCGGFPGDPLPELEIVSLSPAQ